MAQSVPSKTTTRELRANLRETLAQAARGRDILVTLRGKPYVRIVPVTAEETANRYPLRGSVRGAIDEIDVAAAEWDAGAQAKKPAKAAAKKRRKAS
ncbi:MAG: type II toxin-antitoxin system prevent-host-death family antitoxin [Polyangiaceae bacterium]